jgi:FAD-linked sulfhydryl oxidase
MFIPSGASRRFVVLLILTAGFVSFIIVASFKDAKGGRFPDKIVPVNHDQVQSTTHAIAPKLGNATAK